MAQDKRSFLAYCDWKNVFYALSNEEAGILVKHLFGYVNDENPVMEDRLLSIVFEPIKATLKRDLAKYETIRKKRSEYGKLGGRPITEDLDSNDGGEEESKKTISLHKLPYASIESKPKHKEASKAVSDSVSVNVSDSVNDSSLLSGDESPETNKTDLFEKKQSEFISDLSPFVNRYGREMINNFFRYWSEPNKSKTKMRWQMEKTWDLERRLMNWSSRDKNFKN